ncbi:MAG: OmpH family outer membrane protein [Hyphomonadaceae bacterium]|nr:OmpH family outer membrane protein [Hyphomonadaceae bacterium]
MRLLSIVSVAAVMAVAFAVAPDASAQRNRGQSTTAVAVNYQRILEETALGRDMTVKLQQVGQQIGTEAQGLQPEGQSIEQERQRLATATRNLNPDQVRNHATFGPQYQALAQRLQQYQARTQSLQGDMECTRLISLRDFDRIVSPIIRSTAQSRGAGVVLNASEVNFVAPEFDITNAVIQQLDQNQATRTANVARRPVAECQAQPAAAAQ